MKLIIDTDPGVDDAMAYFYAHASAGLDLIALTTIFGNVTIADATKNALWLCQMSDAKTKVYQGTENPMSITPNGPSSEVHGENGFGTVKIGEVKRKSQDMYAVDFLVKSARESPGEITVCAIGPLTNIALAIQKDPLFVSNLKQLVIMGGSLDAGGNVTAFAEANFWNDPHAANIVVNAPGDGEIVIVGLDVTSQIGFGPDDFDLLSTKSPKCGAFLKDIGHFYMQFYERVRGSLKCYLHDPAAVIAVEKPELFTMETHAVSVVTEGEKIGMLQRKEGQSGRKCSICLDVNYMAVIDTFTDVVTKNP